MKIIDKKTKVSYLSWIILGGFISAVSFHYFFGGLYRTGYPSNTFLFSPAARFTDFFNIYRGLKDFDIVHGSMTVTHFPFSLLVEYLFASAFPPVLAFLLFTLIFVAFLIYYNYKFLYIKTDQMESWKNILIISLCSYPVLFCIDRGNSEPLVYMAIALFVYYYLRHNNLNVLFLSFAISMKVFPAVFLVLYLKNKKYREITATIIISVIITVIPLYLMKGSLVENINAFSHHLNTYNQAYVIGMPGVACGLGFGHSLFGIIRLFSQYCMSDFYFNNASALMKGYMLFSMVYISLIALYIMFVEKIFWKQIALLVFSFNLLPYVSADYKLLHLFIPLLLFINAEEKSDHDLLYVVLFGLLMIPKAYFLFPEIRSDSGFADISISIIVNPILMLIFSLIIIREGFLEKRQTVALRRR